MTKFLARAISQLPESDQEHVRFHLDGHSQEEIAEKLGISASTARRRFRKIFNHLSLYFQENVSR